MEQFGRFTMQRCKTLDIEAILIDGHGKQAISVRATESLLYYLEAELYIIFCFRNILIRWNSLVGLQRSAVKHLTSRRF